MSWTSEVPILLGAVLVVVMVLPVLGLPLLSGCSFLARCGAGWRWPSFICVELGLLLVDVLGLVGEPDAITGLASLLGCLGSCLGVLPGPPELNALHVRFFCVEGQRVYVVVDGAVAVFPLWAATFLQELVLRFSFAILLWLWCRWRNARWLLRLAGGTYHL